MTQRTTRRRFLAQAAAAGISLPLILPRLGQGRSPNGTLQVGFVAAGGQAGSHTGAAHGMGLKCICFAEVDKARWGGVLGKEGWGKAAGLHRLAQDVREARQGPGRGLRRHAGPQPFRPLDDGRLAGHQLLYREAADLVRARGADAGRGLCQEPQGRHADGQPGSRRQRLASGLRVHQGRRDRRRGGVPHLDQPADLAAGRRPPHRDRPRAGLAGLGRLDRPGPDAALHQRRLSSVRVARSRRLRLGRPGRHGLPHHRRHLRDHGTRLRGHGRADLHDRPRARTSSPRA